MRRLAGGISLAALARHGFVGPLRPRAFGEENQR
jgi:hypothetical protein